MPNPNPPSPPIISIPPGLVIIEDRIFDFDQAWTICHENCLSPGEMQEFLKQYGITQPHKMDLIRKEGGKEILELLVKKVRHGYRRELRGFLGSYSLDSIE
jgi:hypothetical protein